MVPGNGGDSSLGVWLYVCRQIAGEIIMRNATAKGGDRSSQLSHHNTLELFLLVTFFLSDSTFTNKWKIESRWPITLYRSLFCILTRKVRLGFGWTYFIMELKAAQRGCPGIQASWASAGCCFRYLQTTPWAQISNPPHPRPQSITARSFSFQKKPWLLFLFSYSVVVTPCFSHYHHFDPTQANVGVN